MFLNLLSGLFYKTRLNIEDKVINSFEVSDIVNIGYGILKLFNIFSLIFYIKFFSCFVSYLLNNQIEQGILIYTQFLPIVIIYNMFSNFYITQFEKGNLLQLKLIDLINPYKNLILFPVVLQHCVNRCLYWIFRIFSLTISFKYSSSEHSKRNNETNCLILTQKIELNRSSNLKYLEKYRKNNFVFTNYNKTNKKICYENAYNLYVIAKKEKNEKALMTFLKMLNYMEDFENFKNLYIDMEKEIIGEYSNEKDIALKERLDKISKMIRYL